MDTEVHVALTSRVAQSMTAVETVGVSGSDGPSKVAPAAPAHRPLSGAMSLGAALNGHRNSLGLLRLVLATMVIFSHAFVLGGWGNDPTHNFTAGQESIGGFAVAGFFAISGYLIAKSGASSDIVQFMWRRVLRIFPAFWLVLLVGAFIVGPIAWKLQGGGLRAYLSTEPGGPISYFLSNMALTINQWGIYDIFVGTTSYGSVVGYSALNGSLWTLAYEWGCYLIIAFLVLFGVLKRARFLVLIITGFFLVVLLANIIVPGSSGAILPYLADPYRVSLAFVFLLGSCLAMYSKQVPFDDRLGVFAGAVVVVTLTQGGWLVLGYPALAYFLLWAAARLPSWIQWVGSKNDYSYGIYVYGFLVQQFTASLGWNNMGYGLWVLVTILITGACAWLSWHVVEKRALQLKDWGPGRGIRFWYERIMSLIRNRGRIRVRRRRAVTTPVVEEAP